MTNYEKLRVKWAKKLASSGFVDIENADGTLKNGTDPRTINSALKDYRATYYSEAEHFLNNHKFKTSEDLEIWSAHCEGNSFRKIAKEFNLTFYRVRTIINTLQKLAGLRKNGTNI